MGQQFSNDSSLTMANKLSKKIEKTLNIIDKAPANMHQKFLFVSLIAASQVNYGPLVEQIDEREYDEVKHKYLQIDEMILNYLSKLMNVNNN